jgi:hypothetical protein
VKASLGCIAHLVAMAAVAVFVDQLTSPHLPREARFVIAGAAGLFLTAGLSNFWRLARGYGQGDRSRTAILERARTGEAPREDGPYVATGVVRAEGTTLRAPISGVECVAYQYRLFTRQRLPNSKYRELPIYWGYASRAFRVDSPAQTFRVIATPRLADKATQHTSTESLERAKAYVAATHYEQKRGFMGLASATAAMFSELVAEPAGDVRRDWQAADVTLDINSLLREEIVVPVRAIVSVAGRWSSERRALVPGEIGDGELGVTLVTGTAVELGRDGSSELPWSALTVAVTGALLLLVGAALVWLSTTGQIAQWWGPHQ